MNPFEKALLILLPFSAIFTSAQNMNCTEFYKVKVKIKSIEEFDCGFKYSFENDSLKGVAEVLRDKNTLTYEFDEHLKRALTCNENISLVLLKECIMPNCFYNNVEEEYYCNDQLFFSKSKDSANFYYIFNAYDRFYYEMSDKDVKLLNIEKKKQDEENTNLIEEILNQ